MGGAWSAGGGTKSTATNRLNEAGGTACSRSAVAERWLGGPGRGPHGGRVAGLGLCPQTPAGCQRQRRPLRLVAALALFPGPRAPEPDPHWTRRAAAGPHRPAAAMCDCFHMVLPTWPGAPGSGAPPQRLQPSPLGRVGSARGRAGRVWGAQGGLTCGAGRGGGPARGLARVSAPRGLLGPLPPYS